MFQREIILGDDSSLVLVVDQAPEGDTGVVVWDAALVLAKYLETIRAQIKDTKVIELGSGTGAVGLCAAALGASSVLLTDLHPLLEMLQHNIDLNRSLVEDRVGCLSLSWGDPEAIQRAQDLCSWDFILVSDCVFYMDSVAPLVKTLAQLAGLNTQLLLSYEERQSQEKLQVMKEFFAQMKNHFTWIKIPFEKHHPEFRSEDIQIFKFVLNKFTELES